MNKNNRPFPVYIFVLIALILIGNFAFSYIISFIVGNLELNTLLLSASIIIMATTLFLSLRIIYQIDRSGSRIKKRIRWFENIGRNKK